MADSNTTSTSTNKQGLSKTKKIIISVIICVAILAIAFSGYCLTRLNYNKVYEGVFINDVSVSGLTYDELCSKIPELFDKQLSKRITLETGGVNYEFETLSLLPSIDTKTMADEAFSYGRKEKFLSRLSEISNLKKNNVSVPFSILFNERELQKNIDSATQQLEVTAVPNKIEFGDNTLIITKGSSGNGISFTEVKAAIEACILNDTDVASVEFKHIDPEEITYEYVMRFISEEAVNAEYTIENHRIIFSESSPGVTLSETDLKAALETTTGNVIRVPAKITHPEVTSEALRSQIVAHELGKFTSDYSSSTADRAYNIKLACEKINGYVLEPGEEFSYNDVVGPRTAERGFRIANVYVGNTVQPGIGGGICQESSTMYNAIIFANLEITERRNHTLPVSYVPMGRDATVSYGTTDFRFKNNTSHPIEIIATAEGGINTVSIMGTDEHPEREIKIVTSQTSSTPPKVVVNYSANLPAGEVKVESSGSSGSSYAAYKVIYENGVEVSREKLPNSTYAGKDRVEIHGTGAVGGITSNDYYPQSYDTIPSSTTSNYVPNIPAQQEATYQAEASYAPYTPEIPAE